MEMPKKRPKEQGNQTIKHIYYVQQGKIIETLSLYQNTE